MDIRESFDSLLKAAELELKKVEQAGAAAIGRGDVNQAHIAIEQVRNIQNVIQSIYHLQNQWKQLIPEAGTVTPPPKGKTPQKCYWLPILQALVEMGGKGRTRLVLDRVGQIMTNILNEFDREKLRVVRELRWRNTAGWARFDLVKAGYMSKQSPKAIWEITEEGRKYLQSHAAEVR